MLDQFTLMVVGIVLLAACFVFFLTKQAYAERLRQKEREIGELSNRLALSERQIFHDKNELNAILSSMVEGVIVVRQDEQILYVSPNVSDMLEMRSREVTSKPYWEVIRHQEINASLKEALHQSKAVNKEIALIGPEDIFFSMQISPVVQDGRLTSVVAVFHDIT
jgi:two-component system, OmpR family, phosphate regulon sensor histidine kinase PhoR